jgi:hypothetical protein
MVAALSTLDWIAEREGAWINAMAFRPSLTVRVLASAEAKGRDNASSAMRAEDRRPHRPERPLLTQSGR